MITRDRAERALATVGSLRELPERPRVVVVDDASSDATAHRVRQAYGDVDVVTLDENRGAAGRTVGVLQARTPYIAFADDDSRWEPGALRRAADVLDRHPRVGALAARIIVDEHGAEDPICADMATSPLPRPADLPGPPVVGFLACAAVVRRGAYLQVGGFEPRLLIGGEEELFATDLASAGWELVYVDTVTAHHDAAPRDSHARRRIGIRNTLWTTWLRRPWPAALRRTALILGQLPRDRVSLAGLADAVRGLPWVLGARRVVPAHVERRLRTMDDVQFRSGARRYVS
ncbi:glycosyltransferase [soil metagenome]